MESECDGSEKCPRLISTDDGRCFESSVRHHDPYIDDVLVGTQAVECEDLYKTHNWDVRRTLDCLVDNFLVADLHKCVFFVPEVEFCGYLLGKGFRKPAPGNLMAIEKWEPPTTVTRLRAFLGFTNYYSGVVEGYAKTMSPLMDCLQVNKKEGEIGSQKVCREAQNNKPHLTVSMHDCVANCYSNV